MAVAYIKKPWLICHPRIYLILYLPCSWVLGCIPSSPILTSSNGGKPPFRYRWSWTPVRVTGETIIFTCTFQGFLHMHVVSTGSQCISTFFTVLLKSTSQFFAQENKDLNIFSRKLLSPYRQETNTLAIAHTNLVALFFTIMLSNLLLRSL